jgi:hypothetical protein
MEQETDKWFEFFVWVFVHPAIILDWFFPSADRGMSSFVLYMTMGWTLELVFLLSVVAVLMG